MPASGDGGGDAERCVVGSGRVAPEAGPESSEPPHEASATESEITARTVRTARRIVGRFPEDSNQGDLQELKDIHARGGSMSDKAKAAVDALKEPGTNRPDRSAPPEEETRARDGRSGPERR
jgi:hypothetical protein